MSNHLTWNGAIPSTTMKLLVPSRRVWILLTAEDDEGQLIFSSGQFNSAGELTDSGGNVLPSETAGGPINQLFLTKTPEVDSFKKMFQAANRTPEELATATLSAL